MIVCDAHLCSSVQHFHSLIEDELYEEHRGTPKEREQPWGNPFVMRVLMSFINLDDI